MTNRVSGHGAPVTPTERVIRGASLLYVALVVVFLIGPIVIVIVESFNKARYLSFPPDGLSLDWYREFLSDDSWLSAMVTSFKISVAAALLATVLGTMAAWALTRAKMRGKGLIFGFLFSPVVVPLIVLAMSYYFFFSRYHLIGHWLAIAAAYSVMGLPFVLVTVHTALQQFDPAQEQAARTLGAGPVRTLLRITLPQIGSAIAAGAVFAFVTAFDEAVIILFVAGNGAITLPRKLWDSVRYDLDPRLAVAGTVLILVSLILFAVATTIGRFFTRRRRKASGAGAALQGAKP